MSQRSVMDSCTVSRKNFSLSPAPPRTGKWITLSPPPHPQCQELEVYTLHTQITITAHHTQQISPAHTQRKPPLHRYPSFLPSTSENSNWSQTAFRPPLSHIDKRLRWSSRHRRCCSTIRPSGILCHLRGRGSSRWGQLLRGAGVCPWSLHGWRKDSRNGVDAGQRHSAVDQSWIDRHMARQWRWEVGHWGWCWDTCRHRAGSWKQKGQWVECVLKLGECWYLSCESENRRAVLQVCSVVKLGKSQHLSWDSENWRTVGWMCTQTEQQLVSVLRFWKQKDRVLSVR